MQRGAIIMLQKEYTIIIADDHEIVRAGIKFLLQNEEYLHLEEEADSFESLLNILKEKYYDLLILDLNLGDKNGLHAIDEIKKRFDSLPILVLSMYDEDPYAIKSIEAGAQGYLNKTMVSDKLLDAIKTVLDNKIYISEAYSELLPYGTSLCQTDKIPSNILSKREYEVYRLIIKGLRSKDIAQELDLSPKTISTYRTRILEKLSLTNTSQLIHYSLQNC